MGRYGVDVEAFERFVVPRIDPARTPADLYVVDEIGKMECFSQAFVSAVRKLFDSDKPLLATIAQKASGPIADFKKHADVEIYTLGKKQNDKIITRAANILSP